MISLDSISIASPLRQMLLRKYGINYPDVGRVLGKTSVEVTEFDARLRQLVVDMFHTMYMNDGVGLAANQIGLWLRVAVVDTSFGSDPAARIVLVNPEVVEMSGSQVDWEGCLSIPGFREQVTRPSACKVWAQNECGERYKIAGGGLLARVLMHECDHLDGKVYLDRVSRLRRSIVTGKIKNLRKQGKW